MKKSAIVFAFARIISDSVALFGGLTLAYYMRMVWFEVLGLEAPMLYSFEYFLFFSIKFTAVLIFIFAINGRYKFNIKEKVLEELIHIFWALSAGMALWLVYFFFFQQYFFSRFIFGMAWGTSLMLLVFGRLILRYTQNKCYRWGIGKNNILVIGDGTLLIKAIENLKASPEFNIKGVLTETLTSKKKLENIKILGNIKDLEPILKKGNIEEILLASEKSSESLTADLVRIAHRNHVKFKFLPDELSLDLAAVKVSTLNTLPVITLLNTKMEGWGMIMKSLFDRVVSLLFLILLSPIFIIIASLVLIDNRKAPVFYKSSRVGRNGKSFGCLKFRTMILDAENMKLDLLEKNERPGGVLFKIEKDPRVTKIGGILRKWSIDEWPQLLNILKGEMSFIGPRPHLEEEVAKYPQEIIQILSIKPGLTGFAQINGRSDLSFEEEMKYEMFYMKNWNIWLDIVIFIKSIWVVLKGDHAS